MQNCVPVAVTREKNFSVRLAKYTFPTAQGKLRPRKRGIVPAVPSALGL